MKKSELKALIKQCVKEALFEEGVLSEIIAEVAFGLTKAQTIMLEQKSKKEPEDFTKQIAAEREENSRKSLAEAKKKILNAIGKESMSGVFEGTEPLKSAPSPSASPHGPLANRDPSDSGVDISGLFSLAGKKWNALK